MPINIVLSKTESGPEQLMSITTGQIRLDLVTPVAPPTCVMSYRRRDILINMGIFFYFAPAVSLVNAAENQSKSCTVVSEVLYQRPEESRQQQRLQISLIHV